MKKCTPILDIPRLASPALAVFKKTNMQRHLPQPEMQEYIGFPDL